MKLDYTSSDDDHERDKRERFIRDLYTFMDECGHAITKIPSLGFQKLDLFKLYNLVTARGGMDQVTKTQTWKNVYLDLGLSTMSTSASYNTRTNYKKYLYLYELAHFHPDGNDQQAEYLFAIGEHVKLVSAKGQIYYAQIMQRQFREKTSFYYLHYKAWSSSHDEWLPEKLLSRLSVEELDNLENLVNPVPSRSSKSNYLFEGTGDKKSRSRKRDKECSNCSDEELLVYLAVPKSGDEDEKYKGADQFHRTATGSAGWYFGRCENLAPDMATQEKRSLKRGSRLVDIQREKRERERLEQIPTAHRNPPLITEQNVDLLPRCLDGLDASDQENVEYENVTVDISRSLEPTEPDDKTSVTEENCRLTEFESKTLQNLKNSVQMLEHRMELIRQEYLSMKNMSTMDK